MRGTLSELTLAGMLANSLPDGNREPLTGNASVGSHENRPLPPEILAMKAAVDQINAFFAPHIARAEAQSRKIAEAARSCREVEDDEPWSTT